MITLEGGGWVFKKVLFGLKSIKIAINNIVVVHNFYFKFYTSTFGL